MAKAYNRLTLQQGDKYGHWTVMFEDKTPYKGKKKTRYYCKCDCGTIRSVEATRLKNGMTQSCGCLCRNGGGRRPLGDNQTVVYMKCTTDVYELPLMVAESIKEAAELQRVTTDFVSQMCSSHKGGWRRVVIPND